MRSICFISPNVLGKTYSVFWRDLGVSGCENDYWNPKIKTKVGF